MSIPKPLVQTNQLFIVVTVLLGIFIHHAILFFPFIIGVYTLITKQNPIILISKNFLTKPANQYIPEDRDQQIFNQWIATICIGLAIAFFYFNFTILGYIFSAMVVTAAGVALLGFCIGCTIRYRYMMWKHQRMTS
ncbi:DUF4395 domain-containing protein [Halobacillus mangrovi]|uniref:DUF4395 domain-containing protein n=1 Tax=Halobacillus mangrovi TaxID=402384 RepID=UPI003D992287